LRTRGGLLLLLLLPLLPAGLTTLGLALRLPAWPRVALLLLLLLLLL
jgi:hypothetical protein